MDQTNIIQFVYKLKFAAINKALNIRGKIERNAHPASAYFTPIATTEPMSRKFGMDRGTPIDRYYIEKFVKENRQYITGACLEIGDDRYIKNYGHKVTKSDVLDVVKSNRMANIIGDLRSVPHINDNTYDCLILTQVLGMIDDCDSVISECFRILKPGGSLLITSSCISPQIDYELSYWRFTIKSLEFILKKKFKKVTTTAFGNAYIGQAMWVGMVQEDINKSFLDVYDRQFQCITAAVATK